MAGGWNREPRFLGLPAAAVGVAVGAVVTVVVTVVVGVVVVVTVVVTVTVTVVVVVPLVTLAVGYIRVSTEEQATEGLSLEAQQRAITHYACGQRPLLDVTHVFVDTCSSRAPLDQRPGGRLLLRELAKRPHHVIVLKLDRAWRSAVQTLQTVETWETQGHSLHLLDLGGNSMNLSTGLGKFFLTCAAAFAELERFRISERTREGLAELKAKGVKLGSPPYGWQRDPDTGLWIEHPKEAKVLGLALRLAEEGWTPGGIAFYLNKEEILTKRGKTWDAKTVRRALLRTEKS